MNATATAGNEEISRASTSVPVAATLLVLSVAAVLVVYWDDWRRMASIWATSETFAHGALIAPISLCLLLRTRTPLSQAVFRPWSLPLVGLAVCTVVWLAAELAGVNAPRAFAVVGMVVFMTAAVCGPQVTRIALFPLAFLFFMVPFGEFLLPWMMDRTADFTVWALRVTGIPVYREGLHFVLPTGRWSVVEACSGLRYLIASVVLGVVYAYLSFRSPKRRALFVLLSIVIPVLANWLRAYGIVMIGHLSGMTLATGVDHLVYGWLFFGMVMFVLFWIGARWHDAPAPSTNGPRPAPASSAPDSRSVGSQAPVVAPLVRQVAPWVAGVALLVGCHLLADHLQRRTIVLPFTHRIASALPDWAENPMPLRFRPAFHGAQGEALGLLPGSEPHGLQIAYYARQHETAEMVAYGNAVVLTGDKQWHVTHEAAGVVDTPSGAIPVRQLELVSASGERLLLLHWFTVGGVDTNRAAVAKLLTAWSLLKGAGDHSLSTAVWVRSDRQLTQIERGERFRSMAPLAIRIREANVHAMQ